MSRKSLLNKSSCLIHFQLAPPAAEMMANILPTLMLQLKRVWVTKQDRDLDVNTLSDESLRQQSGVTGSVSLREQVLCLHCLLSLPFGGK